MSADGSQEFIFSANVPSLRDPNSVGGRDVWRDQSRPEHLTLRLLYTWYGEHSKTLEQLKRKGTAQARGSRLANAFLPSALHMLLRVGAGRIMKTNSKLRTETS